MIFSHVTVMSEKMNELSSLREKLQLAFTASTASTSRNKNLSSPSAVEIKAIALDMRDVSIDIEAL